MLKHDLEAAGIEYKTEFGVRDFHSLRHTYGTMLARSGVLPHELQRLMRLSDVNLAMKYYVHVDQEDKAKAIEKVPSMLPLQAKQAKTGTSDTGELFTPNSTKNPIKIHQNSAKRSKSSLNDGGEVVDVNPFESNALWGGETTRLPGFEPGTYGLDIWCRQMPSFKPGCDSGTKTVEAIRVRRS